MISKQSGQPTSEEAAANAGGGLPLKVYVVVAILFASLGFGAVYVTAGGTDNRKGADLVSAPAVPVEPAPAVEVGQASPGPALPAGPGRNPLSVGEMTAFVFKPAPEALPKVAFVDAEGKERSLDDWKGKVVLLNLWATWCVPCRKEMPGLDRVQAELKSDKFEVVAVSVDRTGIAGAKKFLDQIKVQNLAVLADPAARMGATLRAIGMPATLLIDAEGREIGRLVGPAEWDSPEAKALIKASLK